MNREELKQCLEEALRAVIPQNCGCRSMTNADGVRYVACNRMGYRGSPKMVYKLENYGDGVQLSFLISSTDRRVPMLEELFKQKNVGVEVCHRKGDVYIPSGKISATDVAEMARKYYEDYERKLARQ